LVVLSIAVGYVLEIRRVEAVLSSKPPDVGNLEPLTAG
jgi:hypothetical protein